MELSDIFVGQTVQHVRGDYEGVILEIVEQVDPSPPHVNLRCRSADGSKNILTVPINQLRAKERPEPLPARPEPPPLD